MSTVSTCIETAVGLITLTANDTHLISVRFSDPEKLADYPKDGIQEQPLQAAADQTNGYNVEAHTHPILRQASLELTDYFMGKAVEFQTPLAPTGTPFQQQVWTALREIPYGQTISYLQLAQRLGDEKQIRAAASANGKNPIAILIPCHRVIGSDGSLTGYAGGLYRKQWLLEMEGRPKQGNLFK
jgi:methylated-DNA-[protein]-cysteine S-methyltransferase